MTTDGRAPELFHVAYLVADIDVAADRFAHLLGIEFRPVAEMDLQVRTALHPERHDYRSTIRYSLNGTVWTELVQAAGADHQSLSQGERIHHTGYWVDDVDALRRRQRAAGIRDEVVVYHPGSERIRQWFTHPLDLHGARIEFFDRDWRPEFEAAVSGTDGREG